MIGAKTEGLSSNTICQEEHHRFLYPIFRYDWDLWFIHIYPWLLICTCLNPMNVLQCQHLKNRQWGIVIRYHPVRFLLALEISKHETTNGLPTIFFWWYGGFRVSTNGGTPSLLDGWFPRENPTEMDDDWGYLHLWKPPYDYPTFFMKQTSVPFREPLFHW